MTESTGPTPKEQNPMTAAYAYAAAADADYADAAAARAKQLKTNADILRKYLPKPFDKESSQ